jgi:ribonuclease E
MQGPHSQADAARVPMPPGMDLAGGHPAGMPPMAGVPWAPKYPMQAQPQRAFGPRVDRSEMRQALRERMEERVQALLRHGDGRREMRERRAEREDGERADRSRGRERREREERNERGDRPDR